MNPESVGHLIRDVFMTTFWLCAPILAIGFVVGIVMSLVQIVTSIQDSAFSAVPRLLAFLGGLVVLMPWMVHKCMSYATSLLGDLDRYAR
jgi:flagellar biosynthetic protein FliQ